MNIQEAYNKGLSDAEEAIIEVFSAVVRGEDTDHEFPSPKLNAVFKVLKTRSDYFVGHSRRNNNMGKHFTKIFNKEVESIDI